MDDPVTARQEAFDRLDLRHRALTAALDHARGGSYVAADIVENARTYEEYLGGRRVRKAKTGDA